MELCALLPRCPKAKVMCSDGHCEEKKIDCVKYRISLDCTEGYVLCANGECKKSYDLVNIKTLNNSVTTLMKLLAASKALKSIFSHKIDAPTIFVFQILFNVIWGRRLS